MTRGVSDPSFIRTCKLAAVAGSVGPCFAGTAFLLSGQLRQLAAGAAAGIALASVLRLIDGYRYRHGGPPEVSAAAAWKKSRRGLAGVVIAVALANVGLVAIWLLSAEWLAAGLCVGVFGFIALIFSPLFWSRQNPREKSSPRTQMTSAVSVRYE